MDRPERAVPHVAAVRIAGVYAVFGALWILFSDRVVEGVATSQVQLTTIQTVKGWAFVLVSAGVLYGMVVREHRRLVATNEELETALQQVHILHRILRHNLRNICSVIGGSIDSLHDETGSRFEGSLDVLSRQNQRLVNLSEKSRYLRYFLTDASGEPGVYDLAGLVRTAVTEARERYPDVTIEAALPEEAHVRAHHLVDEAVEELIENAIEHNPTDSPTVWLSVRPESERTTLTVEDDGPGIPRVELSAHRRQFETALEHSQGLGLWLVQLTVEHSGGGLAVEAAEDGGSRVCVDLPTVE